MTKLIPTTGGISNVNGLEIKNSSVVVYDFNTLKILETCSTYNQGDEISCDYYRKGIDARFDNLEFYSDEIKILNLVGMKMNQFQHFVDNNKHPLIQ